MLPVAHAAIGILTYAAVQLSRDWRALILRSGVAATLGSQLPDLIDKPLAYYALLPSGRSLAHSLFFVATLATLLYFLTPDEYRTSALAVCVATTAHIVTDAHHALLTDPLTTLPGYLLWPLTTAPRYGDPAAPWVRVLHIYSHPTFSIQPLLLATLASLVLTGLVVRDLAGRRR